MRDFAKTLLYIQTIVKLGSLSRAAKDLYLSQPSLSQFIQRLEAEEQLQLIEKRAGAYVLTAAGDVYCRQLQRVLAEIEEIDSQLDAYRKEARGKLLVGASSFRSSTLLLQILPEFQAAFPASEIAIIEGSTKQLVSYAAEGICDFAFALNNYNFGELNRLHLFDESIWLVCGGCRGEQIQVNLSTKGDWQDQHKINFADVLNEPFIIMSEGQGLRSNFEELCHRSQRRPQVILETQSTLSALHLASKGVGVALLPDSLVRDCQQQGILAWPLADTLPARQVIVVYAKQLELTPIRRGFLELCQKLCH